MLLGGNCTKRTWCLCRRMYDLLLDHNYNACDQRGNVAASLLESRQSSACCTTEMGKNLNISCYTLVYNLYSTKWTHTQMKFDTREQAIGGQ